MEGAELAEGRGVTRRDVLAGATLFGLGAGLDQIFLGGRREADRTSEFASESSGEADAPVPFYGRHQAGIATPAQEFLSFAAFDLTSNSMDGLRDLLRGWTLAGASLARGERYRPGADIGGAPGDPGEAAGLGPQRLTVTIGLGPGLFGSHGPTALRSERPAALTELPPFERDDLDPGRSGGDVCVQACAEDPQVAFHAVHVLTRIAAGTASLRWLQGGFGRTSSTSRSQPTPRNLMGFKDGTNNVDGGDSGQMDEHVWVGAGDGPAWMEGGAYLVARRIRMLLDVWDETSLEGQERAVGREKASGAPLGSTAEHDPVDLDASGGGQPVIPADAHIRLSSPESNGGARILRRGYSFSEPLESGSGQLDAGLFFVCFQRDPRRQFVPIQRRLAASDALNRHILHTASAVFACPRGASPGGFVGEGLFV